MDLGERRIGLAVGDTGVSVVLPAGWVERSKLNHDLSRVLDFAKERDVEAIVVGIPFSGPGEVGPSARRALGFARRLRQAGSLPVHEVDESFSSVEAEGLLRAAGRQPSRNKASVDETAAALVLQRFLDRLPQGGSLELEAGRQQGPGGTA